MANIRELQNYIFGYNFCCSNSTWNPPNRWFLVTLNYWKHRKPAKAMVGAWVVVLCDLRSYRGPGRLGGNTFRRFASVAFTRQ